jgi:hypothetical protein
LVVAVCVSGVCEGCGALRTAVRHGDGGHAPEAFEDHRPDDHVAAEHEFLAERPRRGLGFTGEQRGETEVPLLIIRSGWGRVLARSASHDRRTPSRRVVPESERTEGG